MALIGGVCGRTPEVRDALEAHANANDPMVTHCSHVGDDELAGITGALELPGQGIAALKLGDFAGLGRMTGLDLSGNALSALPDGGVRAADRADDARPERNNPGSASFLPTADAGSGPVLRVGESATLGGPGTGGGPWGTNVDYVWVEVDAEEQPGGGCGPGGGPVGGGRGAAGLHRAGARRGAGAALPVHGDRQGGGDRQASLTATARATRSRSRYGRRRR